MDTIRRDETSRGEHSSSSSFRSNLSSNSDSIQQSLIGS
ncbi:FTH domain-containing protein [Caenorhabditis elegans]|uniref:FTH domain-containing protein n=1 Tax=Caenorhabditis elegans TaxID=6239 RepID=Q9XTU4_CAEEL|nr:FTH domain-containing protein [Caenorhabditis elegans]CAB11553.2 FTH domain-containing protein [Caenorhabditis elegans]